MVRGNIRRKSFDRQVVKTCPECEKQIPVACKTCGCGHKFAIKNRINSTPSVKSDGDEDNSALKIRRTERTRRERPDFFNPLLIENTGKRQRKKSQTTPIPTPVKKEEPTTPDSPPKKKRGRPKGVPNKNRSHLLEHKAEVNDDSDDDDDKNENEEDADEEIDIYADMTQDRLKQFNFILDDLNRKFMCQGSQPR